MGVSGTPWRSSPHPTCEASISELPSMSHARDAAGSIGGAVTKARSETLPVKIAAFRGAKWMVLCGAAAAPRCSHVVAEEAVQLAGAENVSGSTTLSPATRAAPSPTSMSTSNVPVGGALTALARRSNTAMMSKPGVSWSLECVGSGPPSRVSKSQAPRGDDLLAVSNGNSKRRSVCGPRFCSTCTCNAAGPGPAVTFTETGTMSPVEDIENKRKAVAFKV
mmetsp:Transcript_51807/g.157394  ORF Transcript_51807/g.157394 Transcript_51807/m.157394 type:complete len:221 (+) Transcript_51807:194-856(+)